MFMCVIMFCTCYYSVVSSELELLKNIYPNELVVEECDG